MVDGAFNARARAAIYEIGQGRCIGCGRTDLTAQHRRARGMGGTSDVAIGHPANGVPLCGSGTVGCHGWTEHHPREAELLGWRLAEGTPALGAPFWTRFDWWCWVEAEDDGCPLIEFVYEPDLDRLDERLAAVEAWRAWDRTRGGATRGALGVVHSAVRPV